MATTSVLFAPVSGAPTVALLARLDALPFFGALQRAVLETGPPLLLDCANLVTDQIR